MRIGIISDSHDDAENLKKILRILKNEKIEKIFHLGDYVAPPLVKLMNGFEVTGVLGNNDGFVLGLVQVFGEIGGSLLGDFGKIEIEDVRIALYHGTIREISESLTASGNFDVVFCGHFHKSEIYESGGALLLSPGSCHSYFKKDSSPTFGIFNTSDKSFEIVSI